jgi:hypothetical protein
MTPNKLLSPAPLIAFGAERSSQHHPSGIVAIHGSSECELTITDEMLPPPIRRQSDGSVLSFATKHTAVDEETTDDD